MQVSTVLAIIIICVPLRAVERDKFEAVLEGIESQNLSQVGRTLDEECPLAREDLNTLINRSVKMHIKLSKDLFVKKC